MTCEDAVATAEMIGEADIEALRRSCNLSESRARLLPIASLVLKELLGTFRPHDIAVSSYGIREGMLYEQMPPRIRDRDPLIEACAFQEAKDARLPGFGKELHRFLAPVFDADEERFRIHRAACLLHDVSWRAHPDYRHEVCFDLATRANLGGLTHEERVFIGLALLHRYRNSRSDTRIESLLPILPEADIAEAEALGKAMRFAAMFSGSAAEKMGRLSWDADRRRIRLALAEGTAALFGEVAEARFLAFAEALGAEGGEVTGRTG